MDLSVTQAAAVDAPQLYSRLETSPAGLSHAQARTRLGRFGPNVLRQQRLRAAFVLARQLRNPLLLLLGVTAATSALLHEHADALIILAILALSVGLGFTNEYRSERAMLDLQRRVRHRALALRDGVRCEVDVAELVPGDVVELTVGDVVPADLRLIEAQGLECDQAVLTGESAPVEKSERRIPADGAAADLSDVAFMGTVVKSGRARGVVIATGPRTAFGAIAMHLLKQPPETAFQSGLRDFSKLLIAFTLALTAGVFAVNAALHHPLLESLLFSLAIAVGLTPQLLPAIVTVSLAAGARELARKHVIVKRLVSIEDLGNVDVLFTDKTGTLTQGRLHFESALDAAGEPAQAVLELGVLCNDSSLHRGKAVGGTPLDAAILEYAHVQRLSVDGATRLGGVPFDYERRIMSVLVERDGRRTLVVKGAPENVFARCEDGGAAGRTVLARLFETGRRVVAVATRDAVEPQEIAAASESGLRLRGFLAFADPPKPSARKSLARLHALGIQVRIVTGDNERVARKLCDDLGLEVTGTLTGAQIEAMSDGDVAAALASTTIFARVAPEQKSRIIGLQRRLGSDVGFLGDGVNDAVALHEADVGISVDTGADVAKDAAEIVLLRKDLGTLADGVVEGRRIFANTIKYVLMGTSSNFGNMFSAAASSLFLPFLPATAPQLLLNNLLYDASEMAIPTDNVDPELLERPSRWDMRSIRRFMFVFGPLSSLFDFATFGVLLWMFHASAPLFRAGWFTESLLTQALVVFLIRTRRVPFFHSRPATALLLTTVACAFAGIALPFTPLGPLLGFAPLPPRFFAFLAVMTVLYLVIVDGTKAFFYRTHGAPKPPTHRRDLHRIRRVASRWSNPPRVLRTFTGS